MIKCPKCKEWVQALPVHKCLPVKNITYFMSAKKTNEGNGLHCGSTFGSYSVEESDPRECFNEMLQAIADRITNGDTTLLCVLAFNRV